MNRLPYLEWWPGDYLSDYKTARLDNEQDGCYRRVLDHMWHDFDEQCIFPMDYSALGGIWRMCPERAEAMLDSLQNPPRCALFEIRKRRGQDVLFSKRLHAQVVKASTKHAERSGSGKKGAAQRWKSHHGSVNGSAIQQPMANDGMSETELETEIDITPSPRSTDRKRLERGLSQAEGESVTDYFRRKAGGRALTASERSFVKRSEKYGADEVKVQLGYAFQTGADDVCAYAMAELKKGEK